MVVLRYYLEPFAFENARERLAMIGGLRLDDFLIFIFDSTAIVLGKYIFRCRVATRIFSQ